ncbi:MAG TPA: FHA domain-containing protein [Marinagarivorans sp.]
MSESISATRLNTLFEEPELEWDFRAALFFRGQEYTLRPENLPFHIGRDNTVCQLVVDGELASRDHCALVIKDGQLGLLDTSTNGTVVKFGRADSIVVHKKFLPLAGQGCFKLGQRIDLNDPDLIMFKVAKVSPSD